MAHDSVGARNQPHYSTSGAPSDAADLTEISDWAAVHGNRVVDLASVRTGLTGADLWEGLEFWETDTGRSYLYLSGAWVVSTARIGGSVKRNAATATFTGSAWTQLTNTTYWAVDQPVAGGMAAFAGTWVAPISGVYDVRIGIQLDSAVSAILALKKNDAGASRTGAIAAESVTGTSSFTGLSLSKQIRLNASDYVAAAIFNSATAVWNTDSPDSSYFSIRYVEPLR